jgi:hypothetical protein
MITVAVVIERFSNTKHRHLETRPPVVGTWADRGELYAALRDAYGRFDSYYYRDLAGEPAVSVGWIFQEAQGADVLETWVSILTPGTLKYLPLRELE